MLTQFRSHMAWNGINIGKSKNPGFAEIEIRLREKSEKLEHRPALPALLSNRWACVFLFSSPIFISYISYAYLCYSHFSVWHSYSSRALVLLFLCFIPVCLLFFLFHPSPWFFAVFPSNPHILPTFILILWFWRFSRISTIESDVSVGA